MKIGPRLMLFLASILCVSWTGMLVWSYVEFKQNTVSQAKDFAGNVHTMTLAGLTGMMITGTVGQRAVFLDQIRSTQEIPELEVIRAPAVVTQYGPGLNADRKLDPIESDVMRTGQAYVEEEGKTLRAVFPAKASADFLGKNCLICHTVPEGTPLGIVSMRVSLEKAEAAINSYTWKAVLTAAVLVALTLVFILIYVRRTVSLPLANACDVLHGIADGDIDHRIVIEREDETGDLLRSMQTMQNSLRRLVNDVHGLVEGAARGNFSVQIDENSQSGFGRKLCQELNELSRTTQSSLADIARVARALAAGNLEHKVEKSYPGVFGDASHSINATVDSLKAVIEEIRSVVDAAASGQFSIELNEAGKQGYVLTLAGLLNRLSTTTRTALTDIVEVADHIAAGDLTTQLKQRYPGLFGEAGAALNKTVAQLRTLIEQVVALVDEVHMAAGQIADGNRDLMQRMHEQEGDLSAVSERMNGVADTLRENAAETTRASEMAKSSNQMAEQGSEIVRQTVETMNDISSSSHRISEIIGVIDSIAFQTNILALNAAVEAARAGEQGRGFAVVASEVRSLAQRSAQAAQEIKALITESVNKVESGTEQVNLAGDAMGRIVEAIYEMNGLMLEVSQMSSEQSEGVGDVRDAVGRVNRMNRDNSGLIDSNGAAVESLADQASALRRLLESFRLRGG